MNRIERIINDINNDRAINSDAFYFRRGFSFYPVVFSENYNRDLDWYVSVDLDAFLQCFFQYTVEVRQDGQTYRLKLTKAERKALAKAYDGWYNRQKEMHKRNRERASQ